MPAYKYEKLGTWYLQFYYTDWDGKKKKKWKRGFRTKKEHVIEKNIVFLEI